MKGGGSSQAVTYLGSNVQIEIEVYRYVDSRRGKLWIKELLI